MKKFIALLLSIVMMFTVAVPAFAAENYSTPFDDSEFFEYGEYSIHYRKWEAENPVGQIFMIHGFALSSYCWTPLAELLVENGYTCVMADLPDFGYSTRETADMEKLPREDIMHALMVDLSDDPWYLAGHSMGGYIALALATKYPESVKNLMLYGTAGNDPDDSGLTAVMNNSVFINIMGTMMEIMGRMDILVRFLLITALNDFSYAMSYDVSKITNPYKIKGTGAGAIYSFSMLPNTDFDAVSEMPPVLYINGSADNVISESDREKLRGYLPDGSENILVENGGHMFIENKAAECAELTLRFLAEHK